MAKQSPPSRYLSYLLRLWQTSDGVVQVWRASLERPGDKKRYGFANLQQLIDFLEEQTGEMLNDQEENDNKS
ncbi:MAG: hypothetical protein JXM69_02645 [Anaerolineae bacterium]|nr:hypothetical protein [Anaerolineae bacterium]